MPDLIDQPRLLYRMQNISTFTHFGAEVVKWPEAAEYVGVNVSGIIEELISDMRYF